MGGTSHQTIKLERMENLTRHHTTIAQVGRTPPIDHLLRPQPPSPITIPQNQHTKALQTYASCLNHTQSKDTRYIRPSLQITNLKLSTQECNHIKPILANRPTIQVQAQSLEHTITMGTTQPPLLPKGYNGYDINYSTTNKLPPTSTTRLATEILWLTQRYITILPNYATHQPNTS